MTTSETSLIDPANESLNTKPLPIPFWQAFTFWLKLGFISFGGPAGQIAIMHQELVENRRWISERRFLHALNYCMVLPGPEAQQLATYIGWLMHRKWGGIVAGALFVLPSLVILIALSFESGCAPDSGTTIALDQDEISYRLSGNHRGRSTISGGQVGT